MFSNAVWADDSWADGSWVTGSWSSIFSLADSDRILIIDEEDRTHEIEAEDRIYEIEVETRTLTVDEDKMAIKVMKKDPNSVLDYSIDWEDWLDGISDTISTSSWTVPSGLTKDSDSKSTTATTIWLSGGTAGTTYRIVNRIVTAGGRTEDRSIDILCENR